MTGVSRSAAAATPPAAPRGRPEAGRGQGAGSEDRRGDRREDSQGDGGPRPGRRPLALRAVPPPNAIPAKRCPSGHPNDLEAVECRLCRRPIDAAAAVVDVPPEPLGRILLEDGTAVDLVADLVIGRSPPADDTTESIAVAGRQVSRHHLVIEVRGWRLQVRDCESTNGTFLSRPGERGRRRVPDGMAAPLRIGDTVHFGSRQALVVAHGH